MRRYNLGWQSESARHSLARKGIKTGRKMSHSLHMKADDNNYYVEQLHSLNARAKELVNKGATPAFHFSDMTVSPNITFQVNDKKDYEKYGVTEDYPFVEAQVVGVPIEDWAKEVGIEGEEYIMYLGINSGVNDMHNASVSSLMADSGEFDNYMSIKGVKLSSMDVSEKKIQKGYDSGELISVNDDDPHADFFYAYGNKSPKERYVLARELMDSWEESASGLKQKKLVDYPKRKVKK